MKQKRRDGTELALGGQDRLLATLYGHAWGRLLLKPLVQPWVSKVAGKVLSTRLSCVLIKPFIRKNAIDMSQFAQEEYASYNEFFSRKIRPETRPIDFEPRHMISPCDSKLTVLPITPEGRFTIKHTEYTLSSLLKDPQRSEEYHGGHLLIFRLTVDDYHRYCFPADGEPGPAIRIPGVFHTVNPIANDHCPIYKDNTREIIAMEVGALLVGKIVNHPTAPQVRRGEEKGFFRFGGSTVILIFKSGTLTPDPDLVENSNSGFETVVKYGEKIGISAL